MTSPPRPTRGLRHVALRCADLGAMERFYVELLGYRVEWKPDAGSSYLTNGEDSLALHAEQDVVAGAKDTRLDHIGLLVEHASDVDAWAAHLASRGVPIAAEPKTHRDGCRSCYVLDPERNKIQLLWHPALSAAT